MRPLPTPQPLTSFGNFFIQRYQIQGTQFWHHCVWEPTVNFPYAHSVITKFPGHSQWMGKLGARALSPEDNAIPVGQMRFHACEAHRQRQCDLAHALILEAYPHLRELLDLKLPMSYLMAKAAKLDGAEIISVEL